MSCRHNRLSNGSEALISRITAAGPSAKRPPHIWLESALRPLIVLLPMGSRHPTTFKPARGAIGAKRHARKAAALLVLAALAGCHRKPSQIPAKVTDAVSTDVTSQAAADEPIGQVDITHRGAPAPAAAFAGPDGRAVTLAALKGTPLMVNLWATWCGPCVRELPTLDALAGTDARFRLLAVSQDITGDKVVVPFLAKRGLAALRPYVDSRNVLMAALGGDTLPTTVFYGADGKERWRVIGAMDWSGPRAKKLIDGALGG